MKNIIRKMRENVTIISNVIHIMNNNDVEHGGESERNNNQKTKKTRRGADGKPNKKEGERE